MKTKVNIYNSFNETKEFHFAPLIELLDGEFDSFDEVYPYDHEGYIQMCEAVAEQIKNEKNY